MAFNLLAALPYIGTAIAGGIGSKIASSSSKRGDEILSGTPSKQKQFQNYDPKTQAIIGQFLQQSLAQMQQNSNPANNKILQSGLSMLQNRQPLSFDPIEQRAMTNFNQKTVPSIMERFSGLNSQESSGFRNALASAGSDLQGNLAAQRSAFGLQQQGQDNQLLAALLGHGNQQQAQGNQYAATLASLGLTPTYSNAYFPAQPGLLQNSFQGIMSSLPLLALIK